MYGIERKRREEEEEGQEKRKKGEGTGSAEESRREDESKWLQDTKFKYEWNCAGERWSWRKGKQREWEGDIIVLDYIIIVCGP